MSNLSNKTEFKIGQTVYHREIYSHKEPLKIVGIRESELELEGDYSGGTNNIIGKQWMPINGVSRVYNHKYKKECRDIAQSIEVLAYPVNPYHDNMTKAMFQLLHMVLVLTNDVELNPEYQTTIK
jgi:hypothetical protein